MRYPSPKNPPGRPQGTGKYGPMRMRLLEIFGDGKPHTLREIQDRLGVTRSKTIRIYISLLRLALLDRDPQLTIASLPRADGKGTYMLVRQIPATLDDVIGAAD